MSDLETRVQGLEKQLRLWRLLTLLALILCLTIPIGWASYESGELQTRSFILVDKAEHRRAALACDEDGSPSLVFYNKHGKIISRLNEQGDGAELTLYSDSGRQLFKAPMPTVPGMQNMMNHEESESKE
jgi:hypothetical protein